jgi:hypothetical protein
MLFPLPGMFYPLLNSDQNTIVPLHKLAAIAAPSGSFFDSLEIIINSNNIK